MATVKKRARNRGKVIRRETGLPLPVCMRAAKLIERGRGCDIIYGILNTETNVRAFAPIFEGVVKANYFSCGAECCGSNGYKLKGPRGEYVFS